LIGSAGWQHSFGTKNGSGVLEAVNPSGEEWDSKQSRKEVMMLLYYE